MGLRRKGFSAKQSRRDRRRMSDSMVGSHVQRGSRSRRSSAIDGVSFSGGRAGSHPSHSQVQGISPRTASGEDYSRYKQRTSQRRYVESVQHKARFKRILVGIVAIVAVVGIAVGVGYMAFRGSVGSVFSLKNSNAQDSLVQVKSDQPYYVLISAELGAVAEPLEKSGPEVVLLARVDRQAHSLALINIPADMQVTVDNVTRRLGDVATGGDASLISTVATFAKVSISHFVKIDEEGLIKMTDGLGGIQANLEQEIDDPHAGSVYIPAGDTLLGGDAALTYLRATNVTLGERDQLSHETYFAALLIQKLLDGKGNLASRLDAVGSSFQTDLSLSDMEGLSTWVKDLSLDDIVRMTVPGYFTESTSVSSDGSSYYVAKSNGMASIIEALDKGETPDAAKTTGVTAASPSSFTIEVQNGTDIAGAATTTANTLTSKGFKVESSGNAKAQVYNETLVVYKNDETGPSQAQAVIEALGIGRAVDGAAYYTFDTDILLVIGYDYKPVS